MSGKNSANPALNLSLAFDDVLLTPDYSDCLPADVSVVSQLTPTLTLGAPLLSAAMDTVTEWRMAVEMAKSGGMGVIHKNLDITRQAEQVSAVKRFESGIITKPYVVNSAMTVSQTLRFKEKHGISGLPVVDGKGRVAGIVTNRDLRFERSLNAPITKVMTPREKLITVSPKTKLATAKALMHKHRIERVIIENSQRQLCGLITVKDIILAEQYPQACKDAKGRLRVAAAIGIVKDGRADSVVEAGADAIVIDTAHGHSKRVLEALLRVRKRHKKICIIAGNVATPQGALMLSQAGADVIKVGIGPGSICTTRIIAGVGVPQFSAIANVAAAFRSRHRPGIIADGGIRHSGDIVKAVAAGADAVMIGAFLPVARNPPERLNCIKAAFTRTIAAWVHWVQCKTVPPTVIFKKTAQKKNWFRKAWKGVCLIGARQKKSSRNLSAVCVRRWDIPATATSPPCINGRNLFTLLRRASPNHMCTMCK